MSFSGGLPGWSYRKSVTISRASGAVTNYQLQILIGESSGSVGYNVHCEGHILSSFNDLRFTTSDGLTLLDYWIEDTATTGTTPNQLFTVWVEFDSIGTGDTTFYMYYGNSGASAYSNGDNTFVLHDHFPGTNYDSTKWDFAGTNPTHYNLSVSSSKLNMQLHDITAGVYAGCGLVSKTNLPSENYSVETYMYKPIGGAAGQLGFLLGLTSKSFQDTGYYGEWDNYSGLSLGAYSSQNTYAYAFYNQSYTAGISTNFYSNWIRIWAHIDNTNHHVYGDVNLNGTDYTLNYTGSPGALSARYPCVHLGDGYYAAANMTAYCDWFFVRRWELTEPTFGVWSSEDSVVSGTSAIVVTNNWNNVMDMDVAVSGIEQPAEEAYIVVNGVWQQWWPPPV